MSDQSINLDDASLFGQANVFGSVNKIIDPRDGMLPGGSNYYFATGASALSLVMEALRATASSAPSIQRVLDYACGYGRVLRWLIPAFPNASVSGTDADKNAIESAGRILHAHTFVQDITLSTPLCSSFDLIWIGSLFTHLTKADFLKVLIYLSEHLNPYGVIVFTTHGKYVVERIRTGERNYGLSASQSISICDDYDRSGYGFAPYEKSNDYGISLSSPEVVKELIKLASLQCFFEKPRGWVRHQDAFACQKC